MEFKRYFYYVLFRHRRQYFSSPLNYFALFVWREVPLTITVFPTEAIMGVIGIVVIIVEMWGLPATIMLLRVDVSNVLHTYRVFKVLIDGIFVMSAVSLPFSRSCCVYILHYCPRYDLVMAFQRSAGVAALFLRTQLVILRHKNLHIKTPI